MANEVIRKTPDVVKSTSQQGDKSAYRRATYYLRPDQIKVLKLRAVQQARNLSEVVREAIDLYLAGQTSKGTSRSPATVRHEDPPDFLLFS